MFSTQKASLIILFYLLISILTWMSYTKQMNEVKLKGPVRFFLEKPAWVEIYGEYVSQTEKDTYLVLRLVNADGIEVIVNGKTVFRIGGDGVAAKLWRATMPVGVHLKEGRNDFLFRLWGMYSVSISLPPFVSDDPWLYSFLMNFLHTWLPMILAPAFLLIALLGIRFSSIIEEDREFYSFLSLSLISSSVFLHYYVTIPNYASVKLYFEVLNKASAIAIILLFVFYHAAFERLFESPKVSRFTVPVFLTLAGVFSVLKYEISRNFVTYIFPFIAIPMSIHMLIISISRKSRFIITVFLLLASIAQYLIGIANGKFVIPPLVISLLATVLEVFDERMESHLMYMNLSKLSKTDHLTGAFNRKVLNELSLSEGDIVAFVDINDFKKLNDTKGHDYGDMVLRTFAEVAKNNIKGKDALVRYGGDEFLIFLRDCSEKNAREILKNISKEFYNKTSCDISYGLAKYDGSLEKAISEADKKMYEMKRRMKGGGESD